MDFSPCRAFSTSPRRLFALVLAPVLIFAGARLHGADSLPAQPAGPQTIVLNGAAGGRLFEGIGAVNGGGATSVLLKDYPSPQREQILDLVYSPNLGASISALLVEIPGDGNATQGSMPSHMHTRADLNFTRGYTWWIMREAKKRNHELTLDGTAWSAPGWIGDGEFWSQDAADYYAAWLEGLRDVYGLELNAIGCRNERGDSSEFAKLLRTTLDARGFGKLRIHGFDNWGEKKLDFVPSLAADESLARAMSIISAHTFTEIPVSKENQALALRLGKPIWNTEEHIYLKGFDCAISIVRAFNLNFVRSGATKIVNWYDIAGVYPLEPYSQDPAMIVANSPWSGHYFVREALWGYAHYGQFTRVGWEYLNGGCGELGGGGSFVTLKSPDQDYSVIIETKEAKTPQTLRFTLGGGLSQGELCVWFSDANEQFVLRPSLRPVNGAFELTVLPGSIYSLSTTRGQRKGGFDAIPAAQRFPFPYLETFDSYTEPARWGWLPRYTADIAGMFELSESPSGPGKCLKQIVAVPSLSWAPEWQPYTILGDEDWGDYDVSARVFLPPGDRAGVLGRVNHVGTGWGSTPKAYCLQLGSDGRCDLIVIRGPVENPKGGDAEQQALQKANGAPRGGELVLASARVANVRPNAWHQLLLRMDGNHLVGYVDGAPVVQAQDSLYSRGMAGLMACRIEKRYSTPYFDDLLVKAVGAPAPTPSSAPPGVVPIYSK
ncbi:galactosylceramidase [Opitutaceae bacterium EW11]|nr:galactosylceramidase [Opitutaceae bacterium EW11]